MPHTVSSADTVLAEKETQLHVHVQQAASAEVES